MGIGKAYATVLVGNPGGSLSAKDAFGTSVAGSLPLFQKGGKLYRMAQETLGDPLSASLQASQQQAPAARSGNTYNIYMDGETDDAGQRFLSQFLFNKGQTLASSKPNIQALASAILNPQTPDFTGDDYEPVQKIWK